jgi:hypothetical protein
MENIRTDSQTHKHTRATTTKRKGFRFFFGYEPPALVAFTDHPIASIGVFFQPVRTPNGTKSTLLVRMMAR